MAWVHLKGPISPIGYYWIQILLLSGYKIGHNPCFWVQASISIIGGLAFEGTPEFGSQEFRVLQTEQRHCRRLWDYGLNYSRYLRYFESFLLSEQNAVWRPVQRSNHGVELFSLPRRLAHSGGNSYNEVVIWGKIWWSPRWILVDYLRRWTRKLKSLKIEELDSGALSFRNDLKFSPLALRPEQSNKLGVL